MRLALAAPAAGLAAVALGVVTLAPRAAAAQGSYVAPTRETVFSTTEENQSDPPVHLIFVENRSTVPVTVFSVSLNGCENVRRQCGPRPVRIRIAPGRRELAVRVEPQDRARGFTYYFGFGWRADSSSVAAVAALADGGSSRAREQLAGIRRADSVDRATPGLRVNELTRDDYAALAGRALVLRAAPDSLLLAPGERGSVEAIRILLADSTGAVLGRTRWLGWQMPNASVVQFVPPDQLIARAPGRAVLRLRLADDAIAALRRPVDEIEVPVRVAYATDPHAPTFAGVVVDADRRTPLACADVALEDSAANVVARARTSGAGAFRLAAPRPGTYRVRVEAHGWAPVSGADEAAGADAAIQHEYPVRFTEQMLGRRAWADPDAFEHAYPAAVTVSPMGGRSGAAGTPVVGGVTLGGSESAPVLGILGRVPGGSTWAQFVVDSAGRVVPGSLLLTPGTDAPSAAAVRAMLPRVRFAPARAAGRATCELLRMQVTFGAAGGMR